MSLRLAAFAALCSASIALSGCPSTDPCEDTGGDADGDGVCGDEDVCEDADDTIDFDEDGVPDGCDACPLDAADDSDADGSCDADDLCEGDDSTSDIDDDGLCNDVDTDDDGDGCEDTDDINPGAPGTDTDGDGVSSHCDVCAGDDASGDTDGDLVCDDNDPDIDGDTCPNDDDADPLVASTDDDGDGTTDDCDLCVGDDAAGDLDGDGDCNDVDTDDDGDGCDDLVDDRPLIASGDVDLDGVPADCDACFGDDASGDTDGDLTCDDTDTDDDGDTCLDLQDLDPLVPGLDLDGDTVNDDCDACQGFNVNGDTDLDGLCDDVDLDDDDDGCADDVDPEPLVAAPGDDDGDGVANACDVCLGDDASGDTDSDGTCDDTDLDDDDDGCEDTIDADPLVASIDEDGDTVPEDCDSCLGDDATGDTDGDLECDDTDLDDDEDGCADDVDVSPLIAGTDADGDGVAEDCDLCLGDDATGDVDGDLECGDLDEDDDGDSCLDVDDPNPDVASIDEDGDTVVEDCDLCLGDDAVGDNDLDGTCDDTDLDDDDDLCLDVDDLDPLVASGDTDGDTVPDDCDVCPLDDPDDFDGDGICETDDLCLGDNAGGDGDADGVCDGDEPPPGVESLTATVAGSDITLSWSNPDHLFLDGVVVVRQMAMTVDATPVDGSGYAVGSPFASSGEVLFVGTPDDELFVDVAPPAGFASYVVFTRDLGDNYSELAFTDALLDHGPQVATLSVDLATGAVTSTDPSHFLFSGTAVHDPAAETLSVDVTITSLLERYLFNPRVELIGVSDGSIGDDAPPVGDDDDDNIEEGWYELDGASFIPYGPLPITPGESRERSFEFVEIDGTVDPVLITVSLVDAPTLWVGMNYDGITSTDLSGSGLGGEVACAPVSYDGGDCRFEGGAVSRDGRLLYAGQRNMGEISIIDLATNSVALAVTPATPSGVGSSDHLKMSADGETLWVPFTEGAHRGGDADGAGFPPNSYLVELDRQSLTETARVSLVTGAPQDDAVARDVAINSDETVAVVPIDELSELHFIDLVTMTTIDTDPSVPGTQPLDTSSIDDEPWRAAWGPDDAELYVAFDGNLSFATIDATTFAITSGPLLFDGDDPEEVLIGIDGRLYYCNDDPVPGLAIYDIATGTTLNPDLDPANNSNQVEGCAFSPDGTLLYAHMSPSGSDNTVVVYDTTTDTIVETIPAGPGADSAPGAFHTRM